VNHENAHVSVVIVLTTLAADADAAGIARTLVEERLAACVHVLPAGDSVYRWQDEIQHDRERQLAIKTSEDRLPALEARLLALHPYELPELIVLRGQASDAYGRWVNDSVR
jgi:periplasmic divalent cation tolerance protein